MKFRWPLSKLRMAKSKIIDPQDRGYNYMEPSDSRTPKGFFNLWTNPSYGRMGC